MAVILDVEDGFSGVGEGLVGVALAIFVALLVYGELDDVDDVGDEVQGVLEADGEVARGGFAG